MTCKYECKVEHEDCLCKTIECDSDPCNFPLCGCKAARDINNNEYKI